MTWYTKLTATPAAPLPANTSGLVLVDATLGAITATLPVASAAQGVAFVRTDASANTVTFAPQISTGAADTILPASWWAPNLVMQPGDAFLLVPIAPRTWQVLESAHGVILREATAAALIDYGTIAGVNVETERVDAVASGSMPRLLVFADEDAQGVPNGGTVPAFDVTLQLVVQGMVERARRADAVADLDTLLSQARDALLGDPVWPTLVTRIGSIKTRRLFEPKQNLIVGDGRMQFELIWTESYRPRVITPLDLVTLTTTPPAGTQAIEAQVTLTP